MHSSIFAFRRVVVGSAIWLEMVSCAPAESGPPPANPAVKQKLDHALAENDTLSKRLDATDKVIRERCELQAGDCRVLVSERRDTLLGGMTSPGCVGPVDTPAYVRCMSDTLVERGKLEPAAKYFSFDNWCMKKQLTCTAKLEAKAADRARHAKADTRRKQLARLPENVEAENQASAGMDKVSYLRLSLPPQAQGLCADDQSISSCMDAAEARAKELDKELLVDDAAYDAKRASELYRQVKNKEASCHVAEIGCLMDGLGPQYGLYPESRRWVDKNFGLLEQRRKLANSLPFSVADSCLSAAAIAKQEKLADAYRAYAHDTVLFFTVRLHKVFASLHEAQIRCLRKELRAKGK